MVKMDKNDLNLRVLKVLGWLDRGEKGGRNE